MGEPKDKGEDFHPTPIGGDLPNPDDLKKYEKVLPGMADRVVGMAEREQKERIKHERWKRWERFFAGVANFILQVFDVIAKFILKIFDIIANFILSSFKTLSKESTRLLARIFAFVLALATLSIPVYIALEAKSSIDSSFVEIVISIVTALAAILAGRGVYLKMGRFRLSSSEKKPAESVASGESGEFDKSSETSSKE